MRDRIILHCDMNSFYASVELLTHPELADEAVAVCGDPNSRHGIILAKNERAKKYGIKTAETIWQARKKCPDLKLLRAHHEKYHHYYELINKIYYEYTDLVEPFSIDESWLDVTGSQTLFGTGEQIAYSIKDKIKNELGLTQSVGVSFNKIFAKMGSDYKKPDAVTVINQDNYKELLWPLPVRELFTVGSATAEKLKNMGIDTIGKLAGTDEENLIALLGKPGEILYKYANGLDDSLVMHASERRKIKTVGNGITFKRNLIGEDDIHTGLIAISDTVAGRLRQYNLKCNGIRVEIKDPSFNTISRQSQFHRPTNLSDDIHKETFAIIKRSWDMDMPIRLITITGINLTSETDSEQLTFLNSDGNREKSEKLEQTIDRIREKFGDNSINISRVLNSDIGIELDEHKNE